MSTEPDEKPAEGQEIRAVAYVRVSEGEDNAEESVASQQALIQREADERGILVVDWYNDQGYGGDGMDRPDLQRLLDAAESSERPFDVVLVQSLSRLSRNQEDFTEIMSRLRASGVEVTPVAESDGFSAVHSLTEGIRRIFREEERADRSERARRSRRQSREEDSETTE